ncbi:MAG TPA: hypothetical protein DD730_14605, partial [Desulfosporosinus sp.]|nr:hypothetical protein [Desulfosporosinus sp.]
ELRIIKGVGHMSMQEKPTEVINEIVNFINELL